MEFWDKLGLEAAELWSKLAIDLKEWARNAGPKLLSAIVILLVGWWFSVILAKGIKKVLGRSKMEKGTATFVCSLTRTVLQIIVVISAIAALGVNINSVIAALGAAGITIGLALKDTLANFASGVFILFNRPFKVGDYIETEESAGTVTGIEMMFTTLRTPDNKHLVFPNSKLTSNKVINHTAEGERRLDLRYPIAYSADPAVVREVLTGVYKSNSFILSDKKIVVGIIEFGDSAAIYEVQAWIVSSDYNAARFDLMEKVKKALDENGISIPYPQLDLHMKEK